ncbi:MAG: hypothetical protein KME05_14310 [Gloeocapsa sp. UFS-A4-WI-NPMV-4B04]|jgi:tartrate dehydratase alpha subunit/fumarate hydratase class I-like protein|nr:hypothetical protein [Gloeocapsa sp. UFS-A4-WI-NPMV-4B04]
MSNLNQKSSDDGLNLMLFNIPTHVLLQICTGAVIGVVVGGKALEETLLAISQASEEVFRGDRLPVLKFPAENEVDS